MIVASNKKFGGGTDERLKLLVQNQLTELVDESITSLNDYAIYSKSNLVTVDLPNCTGLGNSCFGYCSKLENVNLPKATSQYYTNYVFRNCTNLKCIFLPSAEGIGATYFGYCSNLEIGCFNSLIRFGSLAFESCSKLKHLIMPLQVNLTSTTAFNNSPFASGGSGGAVYTKNANISYYQNQSNWQTVNCTYVALEDCIVADLTTATEKVALIATATTGVYDVYYNDSTTATPNWVRLSDITL